MEFDTTFSGNGAKILRLTAGEAAEKAGIPAGSIITSIGGLRIADTTAAVVRIRSYAPGSTVSIVVDLPNGTEKTFTVTLGSTPSR